MVFEKVQQLCNENKISISALCREITGSVGNIPTWKKDNFRADALKHIAEKFGVSVDYLLDVKINRDCTKCTELETSPEAQLIAKIYDSLDEKSKAKAEGFLAALADQDKS